MLHFITLQAFHRCSYRERHTTSCITITRDMCTERAYREVQFQVLGMIRRILTWTLQIKQTRVVIKLYLQNSQNRVAVVGTVPLLRSGARLNRCRERDGSSGCCTGRVTATMFTERNSL